MVDCQGSRLPAARTRMAEHKSARPPQMKVLPRLIFMEANSAPSGGNAAAEFANEAASMGES